MKIAYIGSIVESDCSGYSGMSVAGNKFQRGITSAFADSTDCERFTVLPYASFPRDKHIFIGPPKSGGGKNAHVVRYINIRLLKQITCLISLFLMLVKWAIDNKNARRVMIVYNLFSFEALPVLWVSRLFRLEKAAIVADLPPQEPKGILAKWEAKFEKSAVRKFEKLVAVTEYIVKDFAPDNEFLVVEGGVQEEKDSAVYEQPRENIVLYTGALDENSDIEVLLEAFAGIENPEWELWIAGSGYKQSVVRQYAQKDRRIHYLEQIENKAAVELQHQAKILACPRLPNGDVTKYTFPSKIMEYLDTGNAVILFGLEGIPQEYRKYLSIVETNSAAAFREELVRLMNDDRDRNREQISFVRARNWKRHSKKVYDFIRGTNENTGNIDAPGAIPRSDP